MSHNEIMKALEEKISKQTEGHEGTPVEGAGYQLLDMVRNHPAAAEILLKDLEVEGMGIADAEREIKKAADKKHKTVKGYSVWIGPKEAEAILRKFYGLPQTSEEAKQIGGAVEKDDDMDLLDMLLGD